MDALAAALDPLVMQDAVDCFGRRAQPAFCGGPGIPKPLGSLASAEKARAMARRKSDSLIEECLRSAANKGCASVEAPQRSGLVAGDLIDALPRVLA